MWSLRGVVTPVLGGFVQPLTALLFHTVEEAHVYVQAQAKDMRDLPSAGLQTPRPPEQSGGRSV